VQGMRLYGLLVWVAVAVCIAAAMLIVSLLYDGGIQEEQLPSSEPMSEGIRDERDPLLVSLCVVTDNFTDEKYQHFRVAARHAADTFEQFDLDFYIAVHMDMGFPDRLNRAVIPIWRDRIERQHGTICDIMVFLTEKDYHIRDINFAGLAVPWQNGIFVDEFSSRSPRYDKQLIQHELGHIFGAIHVDTAGSVMQPKLGPGLDYWDDENIKIIMEDRLHFD